MARIVLFIAAATAVPTPASATYSILVADQRTGWIGTAVTSCVGEQYLRPTFQVVPGVGAVQAQSFTHRAGRSHAARLLANGQTPEEILVEITDPDFDPIAAFRQYGLVRLDGRHAAFTGDDNFEEAGHRSGITGDYVWSIQGNLLTDLEVLDRMVASLEEPACDLPELLMRALEAGAASGGGDARCAPRGVPSDSVFLRVVRPDGRHVINEQIRDTETESAVEMLRGRFDAWRNENACFTPDYCVAADPDCEHGLSSRGVCCPLSCGRCGGTACAERPGGRACCTSWIQEQGVSCAAAQAPCVLPVAQ